MNCVSEVVKRVLVALAEGLGSTPSLHDSSLLSISSTSRKSRRPCLNAEGAACMWCTHRRVSKTCLC